MATQPVLLEFDEGLVRTVEEIAAYVGLTVEEYMKALVIWQVRERLDAEESLYPWEELH